MRILYAELLIDGTLNKHLAEIDRTAMGEINIMRYNDVTLTVTKDNANKDTIFKQFLNGTKANNEKDRREKEAWLKTPEDQEYLECLLFEKALNCNLESVKQ